MHKKDLEKEVYEAYNFTPVPKWMWYGMVLLYGTLILVLIFGSRI